MNDKKRHASSYISMKCPHCKALSELHEFLESSPLLHAIRYRCTDIECGHTFEAKLEISRTLSPSGKPNPAVHIPMSDRSAASRAIARKRAGRKRVIAEQRRLFIDSSAIEKIRSLSHENGVPVSAIAERFGVSDTTIRRVISESE